jgi:hypothetical protein
MDEDFKLSGILFVMLLVLSAWFWHDHSEMSKKLDAAINKTAEMQSAEDSKVADLQKAADDKAASAASLQICLDNADVNYNVEFIANCKLEGNANCDANPTLANYKVPAMQKDRDQQKEFCFKQFPQR